jgi:hypothetical protein
MKPHTFLIATVVAATTTCLRAENHYVGPWAGTSVALAECVRLVNESGALGNHTIKESDTLYNGEPRWDGPGTAEHIKFTAADPRGKVAKTVYVVLPPHDKRIPASLNPNRSHTVPKVEMVDPEPLSIQIIRYNDGTWALEYIRSGYRTLVHNKRSSASSE